MRFRRSKKRPSAMIWLFLCVAIFLTCLLSPSLLTTGNSFTGDHSSTLQGDRPVSSEYPDLIHETLAREQNPFLFSHSSAAQRVPLRLPVPHVWISYVLLLFSGLGILQKKRLKNRNENGNSRDYIIRYIHNQDGETYRPFSSPENSDEERRNRNDTESNHLYRRYRCRIGMGILDRSGL